MHFDSLNSTLNKFKTSIYKNKSNKYLSNKNTVSNYTQYNSQLNNYNNNCKFIDKRTENKASKIEKNNLYNNTPNIKSISLKTNNCSNYTIENNINNYDNSLLILNKKYITNNKINSSNNIILPKLNINKSKSPKLSSSILNSVFNSNSNITKITNTDYNPKKRIIMPIQSDKNVAKFSNKFKLNNISSDRDNYINNNILSYKQSSRSEKIYDISNIYNIDNYTSLDPINKNITKEFSYLQNQNRNYKTFMEDFSKSIENFSSNINYALFTLYDGHGGAETARFCKDNFPLVFSNLLIKLENILRNSSEINNQNNNIDKTKDGCFVYNVKLFIKTAFLKTDDNCKEYLSSNNIENEIVSNKLILNAINNKLKCNNISFGKLTNQSGSTSIIAFIAIYNFKKHLFIANIGDSSAYIVNKDYIKKISVDHKCTDLSEINRIKKVGGTIIADRLLGELIVSRAYGDFRLKDYGLISEPYIYNTMLSDSDKWLILASDGIWDYVHEVDIKDHCKNIISSEEYCKILVNLAIFRGSRDNISCIVVKL